MDYTLKTGQPLRLPRYAELGPLRLALPRPHTPLAGTLPKRGGGTYVLRGMMGQPVAEMNYGELDCCIMPQVGYHFPMSQEGFSTERRPSRLLPYRRGKQVDITPQRPIASVLAPLWSPGAPEKAAIFEVYRQQPALVYCQVPDDVDDNHWLETDSGNWLLLPGHYVISELSRHGARVVPPTFFIREFWSISELEGERLEDFHLPEG